MHTSKPKDTNGASGAPSPEATGSGAGEKKRAARLNALRALNAIKPPHLPPTIEAQAAAPAEIIEADDRALRFAAELRDARAAEAKAREELEQLRARVKAAEADAAEARREERAARNDAASETRTLRAVCARLAAAEKELEERRRVEAVQTRAAEALTAENARLTAELSRLMAFVPEEALTDRHPTTTEKIER